MSRIEAVFKSGKKILVTYIVAGDPDMAASQEIMNALPDSGADIIELGIPFTDPMADGPVIQAGALRALESGMTLLKTLAMVKNFREHNTTTPIVLMGYFNPILAFGPEKFSIAAREAGVDGLLIVDLPPEEAEELALPARAAGIDFIALATPTTDAARLPAILKNASGFLYYVAVAGITGTASANADSLKPAIDAIKAQTDLPICIGFGIKTPDNAKAMAEIANGVVVGSSLVELIEKKADYTALVRDLKSAI